MQGGRVPDGYRTEAIRLELLHGIQQLIRDPRVARGGVESLFEQKFKVDTGGLVITGQIDRLDIDADRNAIIFDYKYGAGIASTLLFATTKKARRCKAVFI